MQVRHIYTLLMLAGCLPFIIAALAPYFGHTELSPIGNVNSCIALYSLAIVSFMGGILWGLSLNFDDQQQSKHKKPISTQSTMLLSNIFVLASWLTLCIVGVGVGFFFLTALSFIILVLNDYRMANRKLVTEHYCQMRILVTGIIVPCLISLAFTA